MGNERPIVFIQLPVPFASILEVTGNIPLGGASLILHAIAEGYVEKPLFLVPQSIASRYGDGALIDYLTKLKPSVLSFTATVWNVERALHIAREVRRLVPDLQVVFGGPEVGEGSVLYDNSDAFDIAIEGEGEIAFTDFLRSAKFSPSLLPKLDTIHCPYISGLVELEADSVLFTEWGRGCRYRCSFCHYHQGRPGGQIVKAREQISELLAWARKKEVQEIYLLDPSFEQRRDFQEFLTFLARNNKEPTIPLMVELRAEAINEELAALLFSAGVRRVETGLQTLTKEALKKTRRSANIKKFIKGVEALNRIGIDVKTDIMIGLPGDNEEGFLHTLEFLKKNELHEKIQLFRTQVLPGTELRQKAEQLGVSYSPLPPYHVLETRTWPRVSLESAMSLAEEVLQTSFGLEEEPILQSIDWTQNKHLEERHEHNEVCWLHAFDITSPDGLRKIRETTFRSSASACTLLLRVDNGERVRNDAVKAVKRLIKTNPFSTLFIILQCAANAPLDIFDDLDALLDEHIYSHYTNEFFRQTASSIRPQRRLCAFLSEADYASANEDWLNALRDIADIIWQHDCSSIEEAVFVAKTIDNDDYRYLNTSFIPRDLHPYLHRQLVEHCSRPEQLLLPGLKEHWAFRRELAKKNDFDW